MKQKIENAQKEIDSKKMIVQNGKMRQHYHFMPQSGWMNDPNGLIFFNGQYHVFYQTNPYNGFWDCMHWGHAVSKDFVHWEYLPLALAPSEEYDDYQKGGCFSGSAIEHEGKLYVFYTATANHGNGSEQSQCLAISEDGINFEKYDGNPLFDAPEGIQPDSFRDPKVWKHENKYYMVVGASRNNRGLALIYESEDLYHWNFLNVLAESRGEWGFMWECPDFYQLGDKYVLTFSPMGSGDHTSVYLTGDFDYKTGKFDWHISGEMDWGFDFYAPQTFETPVGRRILIGWAGVPDAEYSSNPMNEGWQHSLTVPRELRYHNGKIYQLPIRELGQLRKKEILPEKESYVLDNGCGELIFDGIAGSSSAAICVQIGTGCSLSYEKGLVTLQFTDDSGAGRGKRVARCEAVHKIQILMDVSILEIYINDGEIVMTSRIFFSGKDATVRFLGQAEMIQAWQL